MREGDMAGEMDERSGRDVRDEAVERVLRGLREVAPPEGMQARIAQRLVAAARGPGARADGFGWRRLFVGDGPSGAWWRGAVSGAAVAVLLMGAGMFVLREGRGRADDAKRVAGAQQARTGGVVAAVGEAMPCAGLRAGYGLAKVRRDAATAKAGAVLGARADVPRLGRPEPLADAPLTAEERELVRLVQVADPRDLTTLTPEAQAESQAKEAAEFESFFPTPPPPAKDGDENEASEPPGF
jgi:hypothetical protein